MLASKVIDPTVVAPDGEHTVCEALVQLRHAA